MFFLPSINLINFEGVINSCHSTPTKRYRNCELRLAVTTAATAATMESATAATETGLPA
jgi:hypothetical protein